MSEIIKQFKSKSKISSKKRLKQIIMKNKKRYIK